MRQLITQFHFIKFDKNEIQIYSIGNELHFPETITLAKEGFDKT